MHANWCAICCDINSNNFYAMGALNNPIFVQSHQIIAKRSPISRQAISHPMMRTSIEPDSDRNSENHPRTSEQSQFCSQNYFKQAHMPYADSFH